MLRAVLDTNVLASAILNRESPPRTLLRVWREGSFQLITSPHILWELDSTLAKPYFAKRVSSEQRVQILKQVSALATVVRIRTIDTGVAPSTGDDLVLATASAGAASHVVTGDRGLLDMRVFQGIDIVSPREFLVLVTD